MSRKVSMSLGLAVLMVLMLASFASAQTPEATDTTASPTVVGCPNGNFIDEDGDGVCDNRNADGTGQQYGRGAGNGMMEQERSYVDADGDGVCDHAADGTGAMGNNQGRWNRQGMGGGQMNSMHGQGMRGQMMGRGWDQ
jgi:hypothetical protein